MVTQIYKIKKKGICDSIAQLYFYEYLLFYVLLIKALDHYYSLHYVYITTFTKQ